MDEEQKKQAMITALRSLTMNDKSEHDLAAKLRDKGYPEAIITSTLEKLKAEGFLSDQAFAHKLSERILTGKKSGAHKLAFEMKKKRIPEAIRKKILSEVDPEQQRVQAFEIAEYKIRSFRDTDPRVLRKKLYDFLIRKGYDFQLAQNTAVAVVAKHKQTKDDEDESNT
ncbi:MAG TPA: hypothetical protein DIS66_02225 [Candidatus Omnitrophica bacterium]|nr:hypothetical protein [Candidatus Omnitrophota bacterium]